MSFRERQAALLPEHRASAYYFTFYMGPGAAVVFLPIWLDQMGLSAGQIGVLNAVPILVMMVFNLFIGRLADRAKDWRDVIVILSIIGGVAPLGLFFVFDFWTILIAWTLVVLPSGLLNPILDAAILRMTRRNGTDFGRIRAWGTLGATLCNAAVGLLVAQLGSSAFVPLMAALLMLRAVVALQLPRFRAPSVQPVLAQLRQVSRSAVWAEFLRPFFALPLMAYAIIGSTHGLLGGLGTLLLKQQGISEVSIGVLIAIGTAAEAVMMVAWKHLGIRFSARILIVAAGLFAMLRWGVMAFSPPLEILVLLQLTNGLTFGMCLLGTLDFITNQTSEDNAAEIMSLFNLIVQVVSVLFLLAFGLLVAQFGSSTYLVTSLLAGIGVLCAYVSLQLRSDAVLAGPSPTSAG